MLLVDPEKRAIVVKGSVPGKPGNVIQIAPAKCGGTAICAVAAVSRVEYTLGVL